MIPKLSAPLVKDIRTGEGVLEWVLAAIGVAAGATGNLSVAKTGTYLAILAISKGARRGLLKVVAAQKTIGIGEPLKPVNVAGVAGSTIDATLAEIAAVEADQAAAQAKPGTPAETVATGLAADPPPAA